MYLIRISGFLTMVAVFVEIHAFTSLHEAKEYARVHEESVIPDNRIYSTSSSYVSTYRSYLPSWWKVIGGKAISTKDRMVSLKHRLEKNSAQRTQKGFLNRHVICLPYHEQRELIIWGDLRGAFHSLVRALDDLYQKGTIADDFTITDPHVCFVFNANALGNAPWNLELFELILSLMEKNPQQVLYVKGAMEDRNGWSDQGLLRQINVLLGLSGTSFGWSSHVTEYRALERLLNIFFETLPLALYLVYPPPSAKAEYQVIRFSGSRLYVHEWDERFLGDLFTKSLQQSESLVVHVLKDRARTSVPYVLRALIMSMGNVVDFEPTGGLIEIESIGSATVWSIFSASTDMYRLMQGFFNDAYVVMKSGLRVEDATFTLWHRDVRTQEPFQAADVYSVATGVKLNKKEARGSHQEEVLIGASLDLSKGLSTIGKAVRHGATARLEEEHRRRVYDKRLLRIAFLDDEASPRKAFDNMIQLKQLLKTPIVCFSIAESLMQRYVQDIESEKVLVLFPLLGSPYLRNARMKGIVFFRPSSNSEVQALMKHALAEAPGRKFCIFYQDDELGAAALQAARTLLQQHPDVQVVAIPHARNATSFKTQVAEFKKHEFDALFFFSFPAATRSFIQQVGLDSLVKTDLYGISMLGTRNFKSYIASLGLSLVVSQAVPNPYTSDLAIVREYRAEMDAQGFGYDPFSLEGYIGVSLLLDALQTISGPFDKNALVSYFTGLKSYSFKGLSLTFNPERRDLGQPVWLDTGSDVWESYYEE